jgi:NodT family efflux transporter outer membrane factor (OMF) lipoprotein
MSRDHTGLRERLALLSIAVLAGGCGATRPVEAPAVHVDVPQRWAAEPALQVEQRDELRIAVSDFWWQEFADSTLDRLVGEALTSNHDLEAVAARLDASAARVRIAGADQLPSVDAGVNASRRKQNFIGLPVPGQEGGVLTTHASSFGLSVNAAWEVDLWGRIRAGKVAALADMEAASADLEAFRLSLAGQTARSWFAASEALLQLRLAEETAASYERTSQWVRERYERGLRPSLDYRLALANLASAEAAVSLRRLEYENAVRGLEVLLGRYPSTELAAADSLPAVSARVPSALPSELLRRRPDLVAAERRLVAADARLAQSWRAQFPRLSLTGSAGTASAELEDILDGDFSVWSLVGNLAQPLFQGGRLRAGVKLSEAQVRETLARYASLLLSAYSEVESALAAEELLAERERKLELATQQSRAARRLAEDRYRSGLETYVTVLESQRQALLAESQLLRVRRGRLDTRVNLFLALGGGFQLDTGGRMTGSAGPDEDSRSTVALHQPLARVASRHEDPAR